LQAASKEFNAITFANSYGAEDMVLTDIIAKEKLAIEIFSLDTGRLPAETYTLMGEVESTYNTKPVVFFPKYEAVEDYVRTQGINAFYESIELRKACCHMRKVEPLQRALQANKLG
jgi:phosphoadenosine phosphosulfate reductase